MLAAYVLGVTLATVWTPPHPPRNCPRAWVQACCTRRGTIPCVAELKRGCRLSCNYLFQTQWGLHKGA